MNMKSKSLTLFSPLVALTALLCAPVAGSAQSILLSAGNFAILGGTTISSTGTVGTDIISGNVGMSPGTAVTGFPPAVVTGGGAIIIGGASAQAHLDLMTAANGLAGMPSPAANNLSGTDLGGLTLPPGVYFFSGAASLNGALKLDAQGQNNAYWVFQIGTSLTTTVGSSVQVIHPGTNGGADDGIFWVAETAAITLGADNVALGNYLAHTSITFGGTTSGEGRGLALAAVTLDTNVVNSQGGPSGSGWDGGLIYNLAGDVVPNVPVFTLQPVNDSVAAGSNATFIVAASNGATYQWQRQPFGNLSYANLTEGGNYTGTNTTTLTVSNTTLDMSGDQFRALAINGAGNVTSTSALLTVTTPLPVFSAQPVSENVTAGANTTFSALANGNATYQWQREPFGNLTYANLTNTGAYSNVTSAIMTVTNATLAMSGDQFRIVAMNAGGNTTSTSASLTVSGSVTPLPVFSVQPISENVTTSANTTFSVVANGGATYQWQRQPFGNLTYANLTNTGAYSNVTGSVLSVSNATLAMSGDQFQAIATNISGSTTSTSALLTVTTALPVFSLQPVNETVNAGNTTTFSVLANGNATYQWQRQPFGNLTYANITNTGAYSNVTGTVLSVTNATFVMSGDQFRAIATNLGGATTSTTALLTVIPLPPVITGQPGNTTTLIGGNATFTTVANGGATYQWQVLTVGSDSYANLTNSLTFGGVTTGTLSVTNATAGMSGDQFRAVATNTGGVTLTSPATLTVNSLKLIITVQPLPQTAKEATSVVFQVVAIGPGKITYAWEKNNVKLKNGVRVHQATTATLTLTNLYLVDAGNYRVVVSSDGKSLNSKTVKLTVTRVTIPAIH